MEKHKLPYYCHRGLRGSDNFGQPRLSTCYWIYFISLNPGSKYRGKEGTGKSAFQYFDRETILQDKGYYQGFYESLNKYKYVHKQLSKVTKNLHIFSPCQIKQSNQPGTTEKTQQGM